MGHDTAVQPASVTLQGQMCKQPQQPTVLRTSDVGKSPTGVCDIVCEHDTIVDWSLMPDAWKSAAIITGSDVDKAPASKVLARARRYAV
eukprot:jgi/Chrzof1/1028/Cz01g37190.t1